MPGLLKRLSPYLLAFFSSLGIMILELVASRLVVPHVGASLAVWTSVIGVILAGICLGNVVGGRLADRVEPRAALGPVYALGAALTVACLWLNAAMGLVPFAAGFPWTLRTLAVVSAVFLVPATVLGAISPIVAKIAVEQSRRPGGAIGSVYFWGAVGSIVGTYLAGFWLLDVLPISTIVAAVAAGLALLAAALLPGWVGRLLALGMAALLAVGAVEMTHGLPAGVRSALSTPWQGLRLGSIRVNAYALAGHALALALAGVSIAALLRAARATSPLAAAPAGDDPSALKADRPKLGDLALLAFLASLAFMALEMVAGRLVTRHLGSSIYGWTSVIGVLLGGLSVGNWLGGKLADRIHSERRASHLFLIASALVLLVILAEKPPIWLVRNPFGYFFGGEAPQPLAGRAGEWLKQPSGMTGWPWGLRVLWWTAVVFFIPSVAMGTVSPVVAKLAVERSRRTGSAIGAVYAWGMVGSLAGTFLTGFWLIDAMGTKGVILALSALLALAATGLGTMWHAAWAGIPLGLCVITLLSATLPTSWKLNVPLPGNRAIRFDGAATRAFLANQVTRWGLREPVGDPNTAVSDDLATDDVDEGIAYIDESNYYYIKVDNETEEGDQKRTLVLDNLIHGYVVMGQPRRLDYDYEHIYALVTDRVMRAKAAQGGGPGDPTSVDLGTLFLGGGSYTFPRYLQAVYPRTWAEVAEIDPAVTRANHIALGLPWPDTGLPAPRVAPDGKSEVVTIRGDSTTLGPPGSPEAREAYLKALARIAPPMKDDPATGQATVTFEDRTVTLGPAGSEEARTRYLDEVARWYQGSKYRIRTTWGDARQYVVQNQGKQRFDIVFGDAFNDFSVPWHLTTLEFNDLLGGLMGPDGVYMINIIDVYESDEHAAVEGPQRELERRLVAAIKPKWNGKRPAERLAREAAQFLTSSLREPALAAEWERLGPQAREALPPADGALPRAEVIRRLTERAAADRRAAQAVVSGVAAVPIALRAAVPATPVGPDADEVGESLFLVLRRARSQDVVAALDEAERGVVRRFLGELRSDPSLDAVDASLSIARAEAEAVITPKDRLDAIDQTLARALETTDRLAATSAKDWAEVTESMRTRASEEFDAKKLRERRAGLVFSLIDKFNKAAERGARGRVVADARGGARPGVEGGAAGHRRASPRPRRGHPRGRDDPPPARVRRPRRHRRRARHRRLPERPRRLDRRRGRCDPERPPSPGRIPRRLDRHRAADVPRGLRLRHALRARHGRPRDVRRRRLPPAARPRGAGPPRRRPGLHRRRRPHHARPLRTRRHEGARDPSQRPHAHRRLRPGREPARPSRRHPRLGLS